MKWWWLSFADSRLPEGEQFLGVLILPGRSVTEVVRLSHIIGENPGGEIQIAEIPEIPSVPILIQHTFKLLNKDDLEKTGLL